MARAPRHAVKKRSGTVARKTKKTKHRPGQRRKRKGAKPKKLRAASSIVELLLRKVMSSSEQPARGFGLQDLVYNFTSSSKRLAYKAGYSLGETASRHFPEMKSLEKLLESAGFGKVLYYPSESELIITSKRLESNGIKMGNAHTFEAGIIAGYLSSVMNVEIRVRERHCVFDGSGFCQFVASKSEDPFEGMISIENFDSAAAALETAISDAGTGTTSAYYALSTLPITRTPLLEGATKILYLIGRRLDPQGKKDKVKYVSKIAEYVGAERIHVSFKRNSLKLRLRFSHYNSTDAYVSIASSLLRGYINNAYKTNSAVSRRISSSKSYIVEINSVKGA